jgi:hypothetical protein
MRNGKLTIADVKRHIKRCKKKGVRFNWLGFVENRDLSPEVEALFTLYNPTGRPAYNWVSGNEKLRQLEKEIV